MNLAWVDRSMTYCTTCLCAVVSSFVVSVSPALAEIEAPNAPPRGTDPLRGVQPFSVTLRFELGHDDNVQFVPDGTPFFGNGPTGATYVSFSATLDTVLFLGNVPIETSLNLGWREYGSSGGGSDDADIYDYAQYGLTFATPVSINGGMTTFRPYLTFGAETNNDGLEAIGSQSVELGTTVSHVVRPTLSFDGIARIAVTDFDVDFPGVATRNRDATFYELGGDIVMSSVDRKTKGELGIRLQKNDADGSDWDYEGIALSARLTRGFGKGVFGDFGVTHTMRSYKGGFTDIIPAGRSEENQTTVDAGLVFVLDARRSFDIGISHTRIAANNSAFEGDRTQLRAGFTLVLP